MKISDEFMVNTRMQDKNGNKVGVREMVEYLSSPEVVFKMIIASNLKLPALTLMAHDLEQKFNESSNFPVIIYPDNANATARQNVGRIIKFVMGKYGYTPVVGGLDERARIPAISNSQCFSTCAIYEKKDTEKWKLEVTATEIEDEE